MTTRQQFTLGVEEEFQLVDATTGQLRSGINALLCQGARWFGSRMKNELVQSAVEITTDVCSDIVQVRTALYAQRAMVSRLAQDENMALISAGTHPSSSWLDQEITPDDHYLRLVEEQQDAVRVHVIFGLHVHIGMKDQEQALLTMNQVRTWLPHILALSTNSPFWQKRFTGIKSYRSVLWHGGNRSGIPEIFPTMSDFERYIQQLTAVGYIRSGSDIWWDIRLHPLFHTLEFRICDMPVTIEDSIALAALCQALVVKLTWLREHHKESMPVFPRDYISENKWQALRYGLDATIVDFHKMQRISMRDSVSELLDFIDDVLDDLGSRKDIEYLRRLLYDPAGTGADRQIAVYEETQDIQEVIRFLMRQTLKGL